MTELLLSAVGIVAASASTLALRDAGSRGPRPAAARVAWTVTDDGRVTTSRPVELVAHTMTYVFRDKPAAGTPTLAWTWSR